MKEEKEFVDKLIKTLEKHFIVKKEIQSECTKGRIDLLLNLIDNKDVYFGIECKAFNSKKGQEIGQYIKQANRYTKYKFEIKNGIYKTIPIIICPPLSYNYFWQLYTYSP